MTFLIESLLLSLSICLESVLNTRDETAGVTFALLKFDTFVTFVAPVPVLTAYVLDLTLCAVFYLFLKRFYSFSLLETLSLPDLYPVTVLYLPSI